MSTIRIKICGITHPEDALATAEAGAGIVGLMFYIKSRRVITATQAKEIAAMLPPFVSAIALLVNEQPGTIHEILHQVPVDVVQLHNDKDDDFCRQFDRPYPRAIRAQSVADIQTACAKFPNACALSFSVYYLTEHSGMGQDFDWTVLSEDLGKPQILIGGLIPENAADVVRTSGAAAMGVSGGAGSSVGIKDKEEVAAFVTAAKAV